MLVLDTAALRLRRQIRQNELSVEKTRALAADAAGRESEVTKPDNKRDRLNPDAQAGKPLTGFELQRRLRTLNRKLLFITADADPTRVGIYIRDASHAPPNPLYKGIRYLGCSFSRGYNPEFTVMGYRDDAKLNPYVQQMGWRTVVGRLIKDKFLTQATVDRTFGLPSHDSARWANL